MNLAVLQKGFNFSQDGPGNRLVYHLQGCNLHCPWCSNPESMKQADGRTDTGEILRFCQSCRPMMFGGGGVTFTGGEPTIQFDALKEILSMLKESGIGTCIETNCTSRRLTEISGLIDFMICDFKHHDSEKLRHYTGLGNETVKDNLRRLAKTRDQLLIRIPLIHSFNSSPEDAEGFGDFLSEINTDFLRLEVLRYHEYGKDKWAGSGMEYKMTDAFVTDEEYDSFCEILSRRGIVLTGT